MAIPLKLLSLGAVPRALEKADRYRLLKEPVQAESICLDILNVDPENQAALRILLLALTDQFKRGSRIREIEPATVIARLKNPYERAYYAGVVAERRAEEYLALHADSSARMAQQYLTSALHHYEQAAELRPPGDDDALLRWNTCARLMNGNGVQVLPDEPRDTFLE